MVLIISVNTSRCVVLHCKLFSAFAAFGSGISGDVLVMSQYTLKLSLVTIKTFNQSRGSQAIFVFLHKKVQCHTNLSFWCPNSIESKVCIQFVNHCPRGTRTVVLTFMDRLQVRWYSLYDRPCRKIHFAICGTKKQTNWDGIAIGQF